MVSSDSLQNAGQRSRFDGLMVRYDLMILAIPLCRETDVGSGLAGRYISQDGQSLHKFWSVYVARQLHWFLGGYASTSSRTKWSRMIRGEGVSSSK